MYEILVFSMKFDFYFKKHIHLDNIQHKELQSCYVMLYSFLNQKSLYFKSFF